MKVEFSEYQRMLQRVVREFSADKLAPAAVERYVSERFDRELYDELGALGLAGICFPAVFSGTGDKYSSFILAVEELARIDDSLSAALSASVLLCQWPICRYGTDAQKQKYLKPLVEGWQLGACGLTECETGTEGPLTKAVRQGDYYVMNGGKRLVMNGGEAETYVVFAMTGEGMSAFILTKGMQGFTFNPPKRLPESGILTRDLIFREARLPVENRLGVEGQGAVIARHILEGEQLSITAQIVGIGQTVFEQALHYVKERSPSCRSAVGKQRISLLLTGMEARLKAARQMTYRAAFARDREAAYRREAAVAHTYARDMAVAMITGFLQIAGSYALRLDCSVKRLMRKAQISNFDGPENQDRPVRLASVMRS